MNTQFKVIGAGLFGCVCARILHDAGYDVSVIERRSRCGGNCSTTHTAGIEVHEYGTHVFHTSNIDVWNFINQFSAFTCYRHQVVARHAGRNYFLPFNLSLLEQFFGRSFTPDQARTFLSDVTAEFAKEDHDNLEDHAMSMVGKELYDAFIKGYTSKQWGADPKTLPSNIIKRIPFRLTYDIGYFSDRWQGMPEQGYFEMFKRLLDGIKCEYGSVYSYDDLVRDLSAGYSVIYTGALDELFQYEYGELKWRSLTFETEVHDIPNYQGTAVVNYVDSSIPYTRIHEFKHLAPEKDYIPKTVIQKEYPAEWSRGKDAYYPVCDVESNDIYNKYIKRARTLKNFYVGGRLGLYKYLDMDDAIGEALTLVRGIIK